jgi:hypothetical protein
MWPTDRPDRTRANTVIRSGFDQSPVKRRTRVLVAVLLLGAVAGMAVHYDAAYDDRWPYPTSDGLAESYDAHVGERALLFGTVESLDEGAETARVRVEHSGGSFTMTVQNMDADVGEGGVVQVLGTLRPGQELQADAVAVVNAAGSSNLYKYAVSLLGALLVLVLFFRYWRINFQRLTVEAR